MPYTTSGLAKAVDRLTQDRVRLEKERVRLIGEALLTAQNVLARWSDGLSTNDEALANLALIVAPVTALHQVAPPVTDAEIAEERANLVGAPFDHQKVTAKRLNGAISKAVAKKLRDNGRHTIAALVATPYDTLHSYVEEHEEHEIADLHHQWGDRFAQMAGAHASWGEPYEAP